MRLLFLVIFCGVNFVSAQQEEKILKIQPGGHMGEIWSMLIDKEGRVITTGEDKAIKVWNSKEGFLEREILGQIGPSMDGINYSMALSDDNKYLAVGGWYGETSGEFAVGDVRIYDYKKGNLLRVLHAHEEVIFRLHFIPNSIGLLSADFNGNINMWNAETGEMWKLEGHEMDLVDVQLNSEGYYTAHQSGLVHAWSYTNNGKPKYSFKKIAKEKKTISHMCIDKSGKQIVISSDNTFYTLDDKLKITGVDMYTNGQQDPITAIAFSPKGNRLAIVSENYSDEFSRVKIYERVGEDAWNNVSTFKKHKEYVGCVAFISETIVASAGGENYEVAIWKSEPDKKNPTLIFWLEGAGGRIESVSSKNGKIAFSRIRTADEGFSKFEYVFDLVDRTIRNYSELDRFSFPIITSGEYKLETNKTFDVLYLKKAKSIVAVMKRERNHGRVHHVFTFFDEFIISGAAYGYMDAYNFKGEIVSKFVGQQGSISGIGISEDRRFILTSSDDQTIRVWDAKSVGKKALIYPTVSIFFARNNEWVIWNEEGYFTASKKGASYVGYHINRGSDKEAKYYPFEQFDIKYNRPDIILQSLGIMDSSIIELYKSAYLKRLKRMGLNESDLSGKMNAPSVQIKNQLVKNGKLTLTMNANDSLFPLKSVNVFLNDVPVYGRNGLQLGDGKLKTIKQNIDLDLMSGINKIQVSVTNSAGVESLKETIRVNNSIDTKSDLYIVSLGVSNYKDSVYNLDYAAKDAQDVNALFTSSPHFKMIHPKLMIDTEVTRENIIGLKDFLSQANRDDIVIFFIAGHGVLSSNLDYYFCTYNMDFLDPAKTGIAYAELEVLFDGIKAIRKLLIMDTCHSGEVDKDDIEEVAFVNSENEDIAFRNTNTTTTIRETQGLQKTNEAVKEMFNDLRIGTGATVISSAGGAEYAMESDEWKNGLFTYCLLEGIKTKNADTDKNGEIMLSELQNYISIKVAELSNGRQMPTSRFENLNLDYRIW